MNARADRNNVGAVLVAAAPNIDRRLRFAIAAMLVNPHTTPDALFCLADALDELAQHMCLTPNRPQPVCPQIAGLRLLASTIRDHAAQLAAA